MKLVCVLEGKMTDKTLSKFINGVSVGNWLPRRLIQKYIDHLSSCNVSVLFEKSTKSGKSYEVN